MSVAQSNRGSSFNKGQSDGIGGLRLRRQSAPEAAARAIRESIDSGELRGGDRIVEKKWAERLGIGQTTLREALNELIHQGLLRKLPQRGTYVAQSSREDYRPLQGVQISREPIAVVKATDNGTPESDQDLIALIAAMTRIGMTAAEIEDFYDCYIRFYWKIHELAGNLYLRDFVGTINFKLFLLSMVDRTSNQDSSESMPAIQPHSAL